ncbi:hypothetical protein ACET3Z_001954 [Daucus carota]
MERNKANCGKFPLNYVIWFAEFVKRIAGHFPLSEDSTRVEEYCGIAMRTFRYLCSLVMEPMSNSHTYKFNDNRELTVVDKVTRSFVEALVENGLRHLHGAATATEERMTAETMDRRLKEEWKGCEKVEEAGLLYAVILRFCAVGCKYFRVLKVGRLKEAEEAVREMSALGIRLNTVGYNCLIHALAKDEKVKEALELYADMVNGGCKPDVFTFNSLIYGLCRVDQIEDAPKLVPFPIILLLNLRILHTHG